MKTICIAGKNDIAVNVLKHCLEHYSDCKIICIMTRNETGVNSWQKSLHWFCEKNGVEIRTLENIYCMDNLLFLSLEFDRIIRPDKFSSKELYNIHFSMLPKYKGMFTSVLPILNGETYTGVTLHRIRSGIDTGEIVEQKKVDIDSDDTSLALYHKLIKNGTELVIKNLDNLLSGNVKTFPQSKTGSTYFSANLIDYSNLKLETNRTAYQIQNQIKAFCFRPYQILHWNGYGIIECKIMDDISSCKPGTILEETETYVKISTIDYDAVLYKDVLNKLLDAIKHGNNEYAKSLCVSTNIINAQENHGWTALTVAVYHNNFEMVKYLIENGADIHILNYNGTNLLMYAKNCFVTFGDASIFEYLIKKGLDISQRDYFGKNLLDYCHEENIKQIGQIKIKEKPKC